MMLTKIFDSENKASPEQKNEIINFLYNNLEQYGDAKADIEKAIDFATQKYISFGGFVLISYNHDQISGAVVVNQTGMKDYIPENILVYIATHKEMRGKGIGKFLMQKAIETSKGNIALHVEPDNPARFLYEKYGFTSKYIEMRLNKNSK